MFEQSDDALRIRFESWGDRLKISSNHGNDSAETSVEAFLVGATVFLRRFTQEASSRVPAALDWNDLEVLRGYAGS